MAIFWALANFVQATFTLVWSAFWISLALLVRLVTGSNRLPLHMAHRFWAPGLLWRCVMKIDVQGTEKVDFSRPHIFAANHQSLLDVAVLYAMLPVPLLFVLKRELSRVPFLGWYVTAMGMILVDRNRRRRSLEALEECRQRLSSGHSILLFPEGTRSRDGSIGHFKPGIFAPVIETGVDIVPVMLDGPGKVLPPGGFRIRPGVIRVRLGRPVPTASYTVEDRRALADRVWQEVVELRRQVDEAQEPTAA